MIPTLCFITDGAADPPILDQALAAARGGAGWIQLREKTLSAPSFKDLAIELKDQLAPTGAKLILNDWWELATTVKPYGVHVGQSDGHPKDIRREIGPDFILGLSIETAQQLEKVPEDCVNYLGVGPVRSTTSKPDHAAPMGFQELGRIARNTVLPCMAIGGLTADDHFEVAHAGCLGMAVISAISRAADCEAAASNILKKWNQE